MLIRIIKQAQLTFSKENKDLLYHNLPILKSLIDSMKFSDFNISESLINKKAWNVPNKAPCTYINVYEDSNLTASIFILREGFKMPLHDHPCMNGFLKCIAGKLKIQSYTKTNNPNSGSTNEELYVKQEPEKILDANSETSILSPSEFNYHEITAIGQEPAAFFDILSPPYDSEIEDKRTTCSFYKKLIESEILIKLERISTPNHYWCDTIYFPKEYLKYSDSC